jgi:DNA-binding transcriptional ArsR family regulator
VTRGTPGDGGRLAAVLVVAAVCLLVVGPASLSGFAAGAGPAPAAPDDAASMAPDPCAGGCVVPGGVSLASIFPFRGDRETVDRSEPEAVGLDDDRADDLFDVLASGTARDLLRALQDEPRTATELAAEVDTSLQNAHYHLTNLEDAGAVAEVAVDYSERGREMSVYTACCRPTVLVYDDP